MCRGRAARSRVEPRVKAEASNAPGLGGKLPAETNKQNKNNNNHTGETQLKWRRTEDAEIRFRLAGRSFPKRSSAQPRIFGVHTLQVRSPKTVKHCAGVLFAESKAWGESDLGKAGESFHDTWNEPLGRKASGFLPGEWLQRTQEKCARRVKMIRLVCVFFCKDQVFCCATSTQQPQNRHRARRLPQNAFGFCDLNGLSSLIKGGDSGALWPRVRFAHIRICDTFQRCCTGNVKWENQSSW